MERFHHGDASGRQRNQTWNLVLFAEGLDRYSDEHLRLYSILYEPFAIALSNALRYDELNQLKEVMADDLRYLQGRLQHFSGDVIGEDFGLKEVMEMVREVAPLDSPYCCRERLGWERRSSRMLSTVCPVARTAPSSR